MFVKIGNLGSVSSWEVRYQFEIHLELSSVRVCPCDTNFFALQTTIFIAAVYIPRVRSRPMRVCGRLLQLIKAKLTS
jgi:hypothetical protein